MALHLSVFFLGWVCSGICQCEKFDPNLPEKAGYTGVILQRALSLNKNVRFYVEIDGFKREGAFHPTKETVLVYSKDSAFNAEAVPGNRILFEGTLRPIENSGNPAEFDFQRYMNLQKVRYQIYLNRGIIRSPEGKSSLEILALNARSALLKRYLAYGFDGDVLGVLAALTLGDKNYLTNEVKSSFSSSGAMHVLAVSGLHVGVISMLIGYMLGMFPVFGRKKAYKSLIVITLLWAYAFITGVSASVLRATIMFSVVEIGTALKRNSNFFNTLGLSVFVLMFINPEVIYDVGFQLSYMAVGGIVYFQPRIRKLVTVKTRPGKKLWDLLSVSLAAQLTTTPVSLYYFHQFPTYFWLTNLLVVPASAVIMYGGVLFFFVSWFAPVAKGVAWLLGSFTSMVNWVVRFIEALPYSVIDGIWISFTMVLLLFILMGSITRFLQARTVASVYMLTGVVIAIASVNLISAIECYTSKHLIVYNNYQGTLVSYIDGRNHWYYSPTELTQSQTNLLKNVSGKYRTLPCVACNSLQTRKPGNCKLVGMGRNLLVFDPKMIGLPLQWPGNTLFLDERKGEVKIVSHKQVRNIRQKERDFLVTEIKDNMLFSYKKEGALLIDM